MATDINLNGPQLNTTRGQQFIPELWINEIQMFRQARMLDKSFLKTWGSEVKKGDTYHIPRMTELAVEDKASDTAVTITANNDTDYVIQVDTDRTVSVGIDVLLDAQSSYALRAPYMKSMGYALAKDVTGQILGLRAAVNNTAAASVYCSNTGLVSGNGTAITLAALMTARKYLLENDVMDGDDLPDGGLTLLISPAQEAAIMLIPQFISKDFIDGRPMKTGQIGTILGMDVVRTSLVGPNSLTGWKNGFLGAPEPTPGAAGSRYLPKQDAFTALPLLFGGNSKAIHTAMLVHSEWAACVTSLTPRFTESFENREQVNLMVGRQALGAKLYRPGHAALIHSTGDVV
jgi:Phage capsid protein